jgi:GTP-binding protein
VQKRSPSVVLVGRPNVGKSTLFNRITSSRRAIVTAMPGTTRDVITQPVAWRGVIFQLTDTGGMFGASQDPLHALVAVNGRRAIDTADLIVFVVDGREGKVPSDDEIAQEIRQRSVPALVVINKMDDRRARDGSMDFYQLGFEPVLEVSAEHGQGVGELLDEVVKRIAPKLTGTAPAEPRGVPVESDEVGVAIVGRPNVGKSSLVNRLLHEERVLVSDTPGTTRDAIDAGDPGAWRGVARWRPSASSSRGGPSSRRTSP